MSARFLGPLETYWAATTPAQERRAYAKLLSLGAEPRYGETAQEIADLVAREGFTLWRDPRCCGLWQAHGGKGCSDCPAPPSKSTALRLYDIKIDQLRAPTQRDLDIYAALGHAYGLIRLAYKEGRDLREAVEFAHAELMADPAVPHDPRDNSDTR